jgi:tetratricopeptide (TPR) repeat protein
MKKITFIFYILLIVTSCATTKKTSTLPSLSRVLTEEEQRNFDFNYYEGLRLKDEALYSEAMDSFLACKQIDSLDAGLLVEISFMHLSAGKKEEALKTMQRALALEPENWWYNTHLINLYAQQKQFPEAIQIGEALLKKNPYKESVYQMLIPLYKETNQLEKAIELYERLEKISGVNEGISFDKTRLYMALNKPKKATLEVDKLIQKFPGENRYQILKGDMLIQQGELTKAFELYESILKDDPKNPYVYISLSDYYKAIENPDKSMEYIVLALKSGQLDITTKIEILGQHIEHLIRAEKKIEETEALFKLLIDYHPLEEIVHSYYASFLQYLKRDEEAAAVYESMLNINSKNVQSWFSLMQVYFSKQQFEKVIDVADRAINATNDNLTFYFYKGITLELMELYPEAMLTHKTALSLFKESEKPELKSDFYAHLGDIYLKMEKKDSAFIAYDEAIKYNPNNIIALNNYAYYLSVEKVNLQKAERMSAKTIEKEPKNSTYLDTYAWIFYQQGNYSLAKFYIERAIDNLKEKQESGVILDHYGDILWMSGGNDNKALETWKKAYDSGYETEELKNKIDNNGWQR